MAFIDATIVNIAVPNIAREFPGSGLSSVSWVLNAYNIVFAAFLVGGGQLADLLGRRRVFSFALLLFTLASALCALAPTLNVLIAARVIQAAGAAALVPSSLAIVLEAHDDARAHARGRAVVGGRGAGRRHRSPAWRPADHGLELAAGVPREHPGGRARVPAGAARARREPGARTQARARPARRGRVRPGDRVARARSRQGTGMGLGLARVVGAFLVALLLGVYFVVRSSRQRTPVIDLSLLRIRAFALSNGVTVVMASGFYAYTLCNVLFLTTVWRYSILKAGLALTPGPFIAIAVAGPASRAGGTRRSSRGHRPGRAGLGGRHGLLRHAARRRAGLPRRVAARDGDPRRRSRADLPDAERRRRGLGAGTALRGGDLVELGRAPGGRGARGGGADRDPRHPLAATGAARVRARMAVRRRLLPGRRAGVPRVWSSRRPERRPRPRRRRRRSASDASEAARSPSRAFRSCRASPNPRTSRRVVAPQTVAEFLRNVPVFAGLAPEMLEQIAGARERRQPAPRRVAVPTRATPRTGCTSCASATSR